VSTRADAAEQTITGLNAGVSGTAICTYCKSGLGEGDNVTAYAYRRAGEQTIEVARLYCAECNHDRIEHPSCGCYEWVATARLGLTSDVAHQSHTLTLLGVEIIAESGPNEGDRL
jgi:ribosomal protein L37E